jgi:hypothetical protein
MAPVTATFPTSYEATTRLCSKYALDEPMPAICRTWHSFETTRIRGEEELNEAVAAAQLSLQQEDPLTQSKRELDAEIIRFNSDMKEVLAQASLHEAVGRSGGCASFDTQQAAVVQNTISTRQVLSEGMAHVTRRVDLLNQADANGALRQGDVDKLRQFVETLRHRASDLLGAMTRSGLTLRGLVQEAPMGGSGSAPRILNPVPKEPAQCRAFPGIAFSPLPDLPMLTGAPGSVSREALGQQWSQLARMTTETRTGLEVLVADMHARLAQFGDLVVQDSGRDFRAAFIQVEELILDASLRREALVKAFIDSGRQDLNLLNQAVSASREVLNLYQGAKTELVELASMAIERAVANAQTPGLQDPVPVPQQLWVYQAGGVSPLLPRSPSLLQVQSGEQLTGYKSFRSVPLQQAREQGLCKVSQITIGHFTLPQGGFEPRPFPGDPLNPTLPILRCVETY